MLPYAQPNAFLKPNLCASFFSGYMQIFITEWPLNVKKHTFKVLKDCAGEVRVSKLSVGGCVLGEGFEYN